MKEIVEILFADGLLKIVFATTTFAIGLNMPARSVVFTKVFKFSGGEGESLVETSEYLQMAGRAGRRGKDKTGSCLILLDRAFTKNIPTLDDFDKLLENKGTPLESKLRLSYSMTMSVAKSENMLIDDLLKSSWYENETEKERVDASRKATDLQKEVTRLQTGFECANGCTEELIRSYSRLFKEVGDKNRNIVTVINRDIIPLCIVESMKPELMETPVIVIQGINNSPTADDTMLCLFVTNDKRNIPMRFEDETTEPILEGRVQQSQSKFYYQYLRLRPSEVGRVYGETIQIHNNLALNRNGQLDDRTVAAIYSSWSGIRELRDWRLPKTCDVFINERRKIVQKMVEMKLPHACPYRNYHLGHI